MCPSHATLAAARLRAAGIPNVIAWSAEAPPKALPAMHFARSFFAALRNPTVSFQEAFAVASHLTQAFASRVDQTTGAVAAPPLPHLLSDAPAGSPGAAGIPPYTGPAAATLNGRPLHEAIPGYASVRLCVPYAEFRFLVAALFGIVNAHCLGNLCQALRALLAAEVRHAVVVKSNPCQKTPPHLPPNSAAVRCDVRTVSGVVISIVFGAPQDVLQDAALVEHAVRQTLTADALTVQLKLPPAGTLMPSMRSAPSVAAGAPLVENLGMTSVWVVHLLKSLCKVWRRPFCSWKVDLSNVFHL